MEKILGLDLGTNSIGWAVIEKDENNKKRLVDQGVHIFQEGVARNQGKEQPSVQERTEARARRRHYFRRRLRKIELLKVLTEYDYCPHLSADSLTDWKQKKEYPMDKAFLEWQKTGKHEDDNPYHDRFVALTTKLDLNKVEDRHTLGRALYHLNQRRGFLSGRIDSAKDSEDGKVKQGISKLSEEIKSAGCRFLGEYFYQLYKQGGKIRTRYTSRNEHYKAEFEEICRRQELPEELRLKLEKAIFYQRPLKSQKASVGKCPFEKDKPRCPISHPLFEEFRMLQFINGIRVLSPKDSDYRPLNQSEYEAIAPLFFRKSKPTFPFEEIANKIAGKKNWSHRDDPAQTPFKFNYRHDLTVSGCPVTAALLSAMDMKYSPDWTDTVLSVYTKGEGKNPEQILDDVWHALFFFSDAKKLAEWLRSNLQLGAKQAETLAEYSIPQGYASLSLKAIRKIIPWLREGHVYSHAVYYANLEQVLPESVRMNTEKMNQVRESIDILLTDRANDRESSKYREIQDYLLTVCDNVHPERLYQPSVIELYPKALPDAGGRIRLGSPRTDAFKNPMAMRALFRLRALVNHLLDRKLIDQNTKINIEFARELNDANRRRAIQMYQNDNENARKKAREAISKELNIEPTENDILKYLLWEEQNHRCPYTGEQIGISQFIGEGNIYDIEHTIPRSLGGDDSMANKTLCNNVFNRQVKKTKLPSELANAEEVLDRVEYMKLKAQEFDKRVFAARKAQRAATTKEQKDKAIQSYHLNKMRRDYWRNKYERFTMKTVPEGFSNRQGVDIGIIGKYARMYLNTVFNRIYVVKGAATADFRKAWGLQEQYTKKERVNHVHHCIDAITIACIGKNEYDRWKWYMEGMDSFHLGLGAKPAFEKPWETFTEDVLSIADGLLVSHYTADNLPKQSKKKMRIRGRIQRNLEGEIMYRQGDTARKQLHMDTFYGAIMKDGSIKYVVRKSLDSLKPENIKNIVDDIVREKVARAAEAAGSLKAAVENGIWMNEEKKIPIKKVRLYTPNVVSPIHLKKHRDLSDKEYKQSYHVANDTNYCLAVYGNEKPSFRLYNTMKAVQNFKDKGMNWIPETNNEGKPLRYVLKTGMMILFYENKPEELLNCNEKELAKRLYEIKGIADKLKLIHHQEARKDTDLEKTYGPWKNNSAYRAKILLRYTQLTFLVEGTDFEINTSGKITFL